MLGVERTALDGNDLGSRIRVMGDGRTAFAAEETMDGFPRGTLTAPLLYRTGDVDLVLGEDNDKS